VITCRGGLRRLLAALTVMAGLLIGGGVAQVLLPAGAAAAGTGLIWLAFTLRVIRLAPACPAPGGGPGPWGGAVREPRRPDPSLPPGGRIALRLPEDPPGGATAWV
jgi:hypothetical protein